MNKLTVPIAWLLGAVIYTTAVVTAFVKLEARVEAQDLVDQTLAADIVELKEEIEELDETIDELEDDFY